MPFKHGKLNQSIGVFHLDTINAVDGGVRNIERDHLVQRAAYRGLEEYVELCLTTGMSSGDIFRAVIDALHNESLKAKQYPSRFERRNVDYTNIVVELTDNRICTDLVRHLCFITEDELDQHTHDKLDLLRMRAEAGELKLIDGSIYKKTSGR